MSDEELIARLRDEHVSASRTEAADRIEALTAERDELQQVFDIQWECDMRAIGMWQEAHPGNDLVRPDGAKLTVWLMEQNEALTEQLEAARADAKEAEAYAEELERDLKTCCMAQTVMDNTVAELEAKLATCEKYRDAYAECDRIGTQAVRDLEARLAKVVEALEDLVRDCEADYPPSHGAIKYFALATLAEIKGGNDAKSDL